MIALPIIFAAIAVVMCFFRRMPACLAAYVSYVSAGLTGLIQISTEQYLLWGVIAVADTINIYMTEMIPSAAMRIYTVVGCLAGSFIGILGGNLAAVMIGGALGGALGFFAYTRTPKGRTGAPLSHQLSMLANSGCTPWFSFIIISMVFGGLIVSNS